MPNPNAKEDMRAMRERMKAEGFKQITTHMPIEKIELVDKEVSTRRLKTRGDGIAAIIDEWLTMKSQMETRATN